MSSYSKIISLASVAVGLSLQGCKNNSCNFWDIQKMVESGDPTRYIGDISQDKLRECAECIDDKFDANKIGEVEQNIDEAKETIFNYWSNELGCTDAPSFDDMIDKTKCIDLTLEAVNGGDLDLKKPDLGVLALVQDPLKDCGAETYNLQEWIDFISDHVN